VLEALISLHTCLPPTIQLFSREFHHRHIPPTFHPSLPYPTDIPSFVNAPNLPDPSILSIKTKTMEQFHSVCNKICLCVFYGVPFLLPTQSSVISNAMLSPFPDLLFCPAPIMYKKKHNPKTLKIEIETSFVVC
jgi:hypothetical protein